MVITDVEIDYLIAIKREVRKDETGIYFLFDGDEIVYVGQAFDIQSRIRTHCAESKKVFSSYAQVVLSGSVTFEDLNAIEAYFICKFQPRYNVTLPIQKQFLTLNTFLKRSNFDRSRQVTQALCAELKAQRRFWHISELETLFINIPKRDK